MEKKGKCASRRLLVCSVVMLSVASARGAGAQGLGEGLGAGPDGCGAAPWELGVEEGCASGDADSGESSPSAPSAQTVEDEGALASALPAPMFDAEIEDPPATSARWWDRFALQVALGGGALWVRPGMLASPSLPPEHLEEGQVGPWQCREHHPTCDVRVAKAGLVPVVLMNLGVGVEVQPGTRLVLGMRWHLGDQLAVSDRLLTRVEVEHWWLRDREWQLGVLAGCGFGVLAARPPQRELAKGPHALAGHTVPSLGVVVAHRSNGALRPFVSLRLLTAFPEFTWGSEVAAGLRWGGL